MFLLPRKGQFGEILEKEVEIFLIFVLMFLRFKKASAVKIIYIRLQFNP